MTQNTDKPTNGTEWTDDRDRQDTLDVGAHSEHTKHREPQIDRGASETFADDRNTDEPAESGDQSELSPETIDGQRDLTGNQATTDEPDWLQEADR